MAVSVGTDIVIRRSDRGLSIAGTRITLYSMMEYLEADWQPEDIRELLGLTDEQLDGVLAYIAAHREDVEREYHEVVQAAEENRRYWEDRNRERLGQIADLPPPLGYEALYAEFRERKAELGLE